MFNTFLTAKWENLIMANYAIDPLILKPYLPYGVELDFYDGQTYVSLVGFMFKQTSLFQVPIPFLGTFEEVNLRFYVKRKDGDSEKRGVVFINETVPYKPVAWLANKLYKEHYITIPTKHDIQIGSNHKQVRYDWKINKAWNHLAVKATNVSEAMQAGSIEEYIFEHYYGYTKISETKSQEYKVNHPRWLINKVNAHSIDCDFAAMYGQDFSFLSKQKAHSVILAEGSSVSVDWKRVPFGASEKV
jgi:uncharacterized protein YqjF (DUF2071 family)